MIHEIQLKNRKENAFTLEAGKNENNLKKNRYKDILPCECCFFCICILRFYIFYPKIITDKFFFKFILINLCRPIIFVHTTYFFIASLVVIVHEEKTIYFYI